MRCNGLEPVRRDALAVIGDPQDKDVALDADRTESADFASACLRMFVNGLLSDPENSDGGIGIEFGFGFRDRFACT